VADSRDVCPATPPGAVVDAATGCSLGELCPCAGPAGQSIACRNHGQYASCVAHAAGALTQQGLVSAAAAAALVSAAAQSSCGAGR
jgi:hypothetical protein